MDVLTAYREVGSYRGAAELCGTTHKTVKRIVERHNSGSAATHGIRRSRTLPASGSGCRGLPEGQVCNPVDRSHRGPGATAAVSMAAQ
jgi:hypothetical protein